MQAPKHSRTSYNVGIICALALEKNAVEATLDEEHGSMEQIPGDDNAYTFGKIGAHNVVVACPAAGVMGKVSATAVAKDMMRSFPIKVGLMVGICGGVWSKKVDVRLGDVVVSQPDGMHGGVVQWDYGKWERGGVFRRTGTLCKPPLPLLRAVQWLKARHMQDDSEIGNHLEQMFSKKPWMKIHFGHQGSDHDKLFKASYGHVGGDDCRDCDPAEEQDDRPKREDNNPMVHYGNIASGDAVIKDGSTRDRIAMEEGILAFEMEAAGLMDRFPCVVIRGVCDYADSHKNKQWQPYAAATAACYCKELLYVVNPQGVAALSEANQSSARPKYIPFTQTRQFTGRTEELEILEQKLFAEQDCQELAVVGPGGIGKTQLVLQFAYSVLQKHPDVSVFWIHALSLETFEQACREVARVVGIADKEDDKQDVKELFRRYFSSAESAGMWLMVVDNIDDIDVLKGTNHKKGIQAYLPSSAWGMTVFTTRDKKTAFAVAGHHTVNVEEMRAAAALDLFRKAVSRQGLEDDHSATSELIAELAFLPLAIIQAAAYIKCNKISVKKYLGLMRGAESDLISILSVEIDDRTRSTQAAHAVAKTWLVSFDQIVRRDPYAAKLLQYISCIERKAIPLSILPEMESEVQLTTAIGTLSSYSFISKRGGSELLDMHRLVHVAAQVWVRQQRQRVQTQNWALHCLCEKFPWEQWENRRVWREYMPHAIRALEGHEAENVEPMAELCQKVGRCLYVDGRIADGVRWLQKSLVLRNTLAEDHPNRLASQHKLGVAYRANGRVAEAVQLLEHVVAIQNRVLPEDHPDRLGSQHELANAYQASGQPRQVAEAVRLLEHVVAIRNRVLAEDHPIRLGSKHELARTYLANGQVAEAVRLLEHVVAIRNRVLAEDHPDRLGSQHELANAYQASGQPKQVAEAVRLLEHVVAIRNRVLAEDHPDRVGSQHELGRAYLANGRVMEAVRLLGAEHSLMLISIENQASTFRDQGRLNEAIELFAKAVESLKMMLGEEHASTLTCMANLSSLYCAQGSWAKAKELGLKVVEARKRVIGEAQPSTISSMESLASNDTWQGREAETATLHGVFVGLRKEQRGADYLRTLATLHNLALIYESLDALHLAETLESEVYSNRDRVLGMGHSDTLDSAATLAQIHDKERQRSLLLARDGSESTTGTFSGASEESSAQDDASSQTSYSNYRQDPSVQEPLVMLDKVLTLDANLYLNYVQLAIPMGQARFRRIVGKQLKLLFREVIAEAPSSLRGPIRAFFPFGKRTLSQILSGICSKLELFQPSVDMTKALSDIPSEEPRTSTARWNEQVPEDHDLQTSEQNTKEQTEISQHPAPDADDVGRGKGDSDDSDDSGDDNGEEDQKQHRDDIQQARTFLLQSTSLSRYKERIELLTNPARGLDAALAIGDLSMIQDLLQYRFTAVAVGPWKWLLELKELGYGASEIAELLLEQHRDHPWIYFKNQVTDLEKKPQIDIHINGCVHRGGEAFAQAETHSVIANTTPKLGDEGLVEHDIDTVQIVLSLCGLAGVVPPSDSSEEWHGEVLFEGDEVASVSFRTEGVSRTTLWSRIKRSLGSFSTAFAVVQQRGQCCDSFTLLRGPSAAPPNPVPAIELCSLKADLVLDFAQLVEEVADITDEFEVQRCAMRASTILELVSPNFAQKSTGISMDECVNLCGTAVQLLCLSFVSYCQAHTGALELFFLQYRLRHIRLMGTKSANEAGDHVVARLQMLTCIGAMLQDSVVVFGHEGFPVCAHSDEVPAMDLFPDGQTVALTSDDRTVRLWNAQTGDQMHRLNDGSDSDSCRSNLLACAEDIVDTWGPGTFVMALDANGKEKIASVLLCGGRIFLPSDGRRDIYHWSSDSWETAVEEGTLYRTDKVVIAGTMAVNQACGLREEDCLKSCEAYRDTLGAQEPHWKVIEKHAALQGGQYVNMLFQQTWAKCPGITQKELHLSKPIDELVPFLESTWGLQVSFCSGYARRVKMRELMADLLPAFMGQQIQSLSHWEKLRDVHNVIDVLRHENLPQWVPLMAKGDHKCFKFLCRTVRSIATALRVTGIDPSGKHFVVAWFPTQACTPLQCIRIPVESDTYWTRVLQDSSDCATYAYFTAKCLQYQGQGCRRGQSSRIAPLLLLETEVHRHIDHPKSHQMLKWPWRLEHGEIYPIGRFRRSQVSMLRARVERSPSYATPRLIVRAYGIPMEIMDRIRWRPPRFERIRERQEPEHQVKEVLIAS